MPRGLRVWWAIVLAFFQDSLVYRASAIIWILTDVVTAITMPLIWLASYNGRHSIHGFDQSQIVVYYLVILAITSLVESHMMWEIATDVKQGKFNIYLIRPFSYMAYMYAANLGWRVMRTSMAIPIFCLVALAFHRYLPSGMQVHIGPAFWLAILLGHFVSFQLTYMMGLLSLWLYEARSVYNFYYLPAIIFSGQIAPLALFPAALRTVAKFLPFSYTLSFPAGIFLGRVSPTELTFGFTMQLVWIAACYCASILLWRGGVRRFSAFGI